MMHLSMMKSMKCDRSKKIHFLIEDNMTPILGPSMIHT